MRALAQVLADRGALKPGMSAAEAADILWLFNDPAVYHRLVIEQGWPADRYQSWLADAFVGLLIAPGYQPVLLNANLMPEQPRCLVTHDSYR